MLLGPVPAVAECVVREKAQQIGAPLVRIYHSASIVLRSCTDGVQSFDMKTAQGEYHDLCAPLRGPQQVHSSTMAVLAAEWIGRHFSPITATQIQDGVKATTWPGRIHVVREQPRIVLDGAHNPDAAENLVRFLDAEFRGGDLLVIFGAMRDKDYLTFGHLLFPRARRVFLTRSKNSRFAEVDTLVAAFQPDFPEKMSGSSSLAQALEEAVSLARPESWIVVTGSLYLVGEAMRILNLDPLAPAGYPSFGSLSS